MRIEDHHIEVKFPKMFTDLSIPPGYYKMKFIFGGANVTEHADKGGRELAGTGGAPDELVIEIKWNTPGAHYQNQNTGRPGTRVFIPFGRFPFVGRRGV